MRIDAPSARLLTPSNSEEGLSSLRFIERMARISHKAEDRQTIDSWRSFLSSVVLGHGDWSVTEHQSATVIFEVNRGVTHELVRHRLFGFTQESTRFVNYTQLGHDLRCIPSGAVHPGARAEWEEDLRSAETIYRKWVDRGYAPQIARDHLPQATGTTIAVTGNFRNWRHAFLMRTTREAHPDFRAVMCSLLAVFQERIPILYDDIVPGARQIENLRKAR